MKPWGGFSSEADRNKSEKRLGGHSRNDREAGLGAAWDTAMESPSERSHGTGHCDHITEHFSSSMRKDWTYDTATLMIFSGM